mgnify:CR=1 FL=1
MRGGDISNESPPRVAVTLDCIIDRTTVMNKVLGFFTLPKEEITYSLAKLNTFWRFSVKYEYGLELIGFGHTNKEMNQVLEDLNNLGPNPFNYTKAYLFPEEFISELPWRPDLKGVIDLPERALMYGSRYLDISRMI